MKILITGGSSLLGRYLYRTKPKDVDLTSTWYTNQVEQTTTHLDITNQAQVRYVFGIVKPDVVIHLAANGSVDHAEKFFDEAHWTNVIGTKNIAEATKYYRAKLVYISSNAVYDGDNGPYNELSHQRPINKYGQIKHEAEIKSLVVDDLVIIRPFLLYGWPYPGGRTNWAVTIVNRLAMGETMQIVNDHVWMPTYAQDAAAAIWQLIAHENAMFNLAAPDRLTLYEFAVKVAETWGLDAGLIEPVSSDYFKEIAPRPHDTTYDLSKLNEAGITLSGVDEGLEKMRAER